MVSNTPKREVTNNLVDRSVFDDASTLLMFSSHKDPQALPPTNLPSATNLQHQNVLTPGRIDPSVNERTASTSHIQSSIPIGQDRRLSVVNQPVSRSGSNSAAAVAAAAALATAAAVPLPLKKHEIESPNNTAHKDSGSPSSSPKHTDDSTSKHKIWPVLDSYIVDPDSGIITCICGFDDDDGFTIQCDHCYRWQHAVCYGIEDINEVPEQYLCNVCQPRKLDAKTARQRQKRQRETLFNKSAETLDNQDSKRRKVGSDDGVEHSDEGGAKDNKENQSRTTRRRASKTTSTTTNNPPVTNQIISIVPDIRRKEHLLPPKEAFPSVYLSIDESRYEDKYVKLFIEKHKNDDCVISYNSLEFKSIPIEVKSYNEANNARYFPGFMKLGVFLTEGCQSDDFITEMVGHLNFQKNYLMDPRNQYRIWGTPKRKVTFHEHWPITIDQRSCGNYTRFLRRSCQPNVKLATIRLSDGSIKFVLRATRAIEDGEELYIGWQWDLRHPILQIINGTTDFESFDDTVKYSLIHSVDTILSNCECGCGNTSKDCYLLNTKKFSQSLVKSVKSKMSNRYKLNQILSQYQLNIKKRKQPILNRISNQIHDKNKHDLKSLHEGILNLSYDDPRRTNKKATTSTTSKKEDDADSKMKIVVDNKDYSGTRLSQPFIRSLAANGIDNNEPYKKKKDLIKLLSKYDESNIKDIEKLPIPVALPYSKTIASEIVEGPGDQVHASDARSSTSEGITSGVNNSETVGRSIYPKPIDSVTDTASIQSSHSSNLKKKLSFADYRKKLQK
ncbi:hypothetical protein C6P45_005483 [Maudiozyma exigua]|uniref:SET domain-containing protein n=1 Tax=Maudiozyma exigua TaxID=34358 RepID=A0A9P7BA57_MAUEX|nr:hypothetical protein C6P45_005483 [Kazachstania exigua]